MSMASISPGPSAAFLDHSVLSSDRDHADFGACDHKPVAGDHVAHRTQAVAVHPRDNPGAHRSCRQRGGAVPRLHHRVGIGVHRLPRIRHGVDRSTTPRAPAWILAIGAESGPRARSPRTPHRAPRCPKTPAATIGLISSASAPNEIRRPCGSRGCFIQLRLPFSVLISPLWASMRKGWASHHCGNVLVE